MRLKITFEDEFLLTGQSESSIHNFVMQYKEGGGWPAKTVVWVAVSPIFKKISVQNDYFIPLYFVIFLLGGLW